MRASERNNKSRNLYMSTDTTMLDTFKHSYFTKQFPIWKPFGKCRLLVLAVKKSKNLRGGLSVLSLDHVVKARNDKIFCNIDRYPIDILDIAYKESMELSSANCS